MKNNKKAGINLSFEMMVALIIGLIVLIIFVGIFIGDKNDVENQQENVNKKFCDKNGLGLFEDCEKKK